MARCYRMVICEAYTLPVAESSCLHRRSGPTVQTLMVASRSPIIWFHPNFPTSLPASMFYSNSVSFSLSLTHTHTHRAHALLTVKPPEHFSAQKPTWTGFTLLHDFWHLEVWNWARQVLWPIWTRVQTSQYFHHFSNCRHDLSRIKQLFFPIWLPNATSGEVPLCGAQTIVTLWPEMFNWILKDEKAAGSWLSVLWQGHTA